MEFPRIALKVSAKQFSKLINMGNRIASSLIGNANFTSVSPSIAILMASVTDVTNAYALWHGTGSRGSHENYVDLCNKALNLQIIIKALAQYVANTSEQAAASDYSAMRAIMITSGFELAQPKTPRSTLQAVRNFRNFISRSLPWNMVKLRWKRPLNTLTTADVSLYEVLRSVTPDFSTAVKVGNTTKGEFVDTNTSAVAVTWYYWVVPYNAAGAGVPSAMLAVSVLPV